MPESRSPFLNEKSINIDLKNRFLAGILTWVMPGLGHYYQGRYAKAVIFFCCIMPIFITGCALASSKEVGIARNVYWSWRPGDMHLWWLAQAPLGPAAIPSGIQAWTINTGQPPMFGQFMAPPQLAHGDRTGVAPQIDMIRQRLPHFELATYFVVIAGLMNLLVIFDAMGGPFVGIRKETKYYDEQEKL